MFPLYRLDGGTQADNKKRDLPQKRVAQMWEREGIRWKTSGKLDMTLR